MTMLRRRAVFTLVAVLATLALISGYSVRGRATPAYAGTPSVAATGCTNSANPMDINFSFTPVVGLNQNQNTVIQAGVQVAPARLSVATPLLSVMCGTVLEDLNGPDNDGNVNTVDGGTFSASVTGPTMITESNTTSYSWSCGSAFPPAALPPAPGNESCQGGVAGVSGPPETALPAGTPIVWPSAGNTFHVALQPGTSFGSIGTATPSILVTVNFSTFPAVGVTHVAAPDLSAVADGGEVAIAGRSPQGGLWFRETAGGNFGNTMQIAPAGVASGPQAVTVGADLYEFFRSTTNELHYIKRAGGAWGAEQNLGGVIAGSPSAAVDGNGTLIVAALNGAGNVFVNSLTSGGSWSGFQALGGILSGRLELIGYNGDVYLFGVNPGGVLWQRQWNHTSSAWGSWASLDGVLTSAPAAAVYNGSLSVFGVNAAGVLWYRQLSGGSWGAWTSLDGVVGSDPAVAGTTNTLLAFGTNPAGALFDRREAGSGFGAWDPLDGLLASGPEAVAVGPQTYAFALDAAGNTWYRLWNGSAFGAWQNLGGATATVSSPASGRAASTTLAGSAHIQVP